MSPPKLPFCSFRCLPSVVTERFARWMFPGVNWAIVWWSVIGVLAAVSVYDPPRCRLALRHRTRQGRTRQRGWHSRCHGPPHHLARIQVEHDSQVRPARSHSDASDVGHPGRVDHRRLELPVENILGHRQCVLAIGGMHELRLPARSLAMQSHPRSGKADA